MAKKYFSFYFLVNMRTVEKSDALVSVAISGPISLLGFDSGACRSLGSSWMVMRTALTRRERTWNIMSTATEVRLSDIIEPITISAVTSIGIGGSSETPPS